MAAFQGCLAGASGSPRTLRALGIGGGPSLAGLKKFLQQFRWRLPPGGFRGCIADLHDWSAAAEAQGYSFVQLDANRPTTSQAREAKRRIARADIIVIAHVLKAGPQGAVGRPWGERRLRLGNTKG